MTKKDKDGKNTQCKRCVRMLIMSPDRRKRTEDEEEKTGKRRGEKNFPKRTFSKNVIMNYGIFMYKRKMQNT